MHRGYDDTTKFIKQSYEKLRVMFLQSTQSSCNQKCQSRISPKLLKKVAMSQMRKEKVQLVVCRLERMALDAFERIYTLSGL